MVFMCSFLLRFIKKNFWNAAQMQIRTWFVPHTGQRSTIWNQIPYNGLFSSFLLRLFRKVSDMLRKCKYELYCPKVVRKIVRLFNVLPLYDDFLGFLCKHDHILSFVPPKGLNSLFRPPPPKVHIVHFVPPPDFCHATPMLLYVLRNSHKKPSFT